MKEEDLDLNDHIARAKEGNQAAFRFLLNLYWLEVYFFVLKRIKNENEAEDIAIQTFSKAFDKIATFNENYTFKTWVITIAKNTHIDLARKKKKSIITETTNDQQEKVHLVPDENPTPEDHIIREQNLAKLQKNIRQLKPKYQLVINLRYFQELSYKEIALQTNEPINNVKVKLLRAKKLLAEIIKKG